MACRNRIIEPSTFSNPVPEGTRNGLFAMTATEVFVQYTCDRMPTCRKPGLQDEGGKQRQRDSVDDQPDSPPVPNKCPIPGTGSAELPLGDRPLEGHLAWQGGPWPCDDLPFTGSSRRMKTWKTHGLSLSPLAVMRWVPAVNAKRAVDTMDRVFAKLPRNDRTIHGHVYLSGLSSTSRFSFPQRANIWNATAAQIVGGFLSDRPSPRHSRNPFRGTDRPVSPSPSRKSNTAAIAGGVAGGVVAIAAIAGLAQQRAKAPPAASLVNDVPPPLLPSPMTQVHPASSPSYADYTEGSRMSLYLQEHIQASTPSVNVPVSYDGYSNGSSPTNMQPLRPQGYHGLPTV
ncbi:hypothetical protein EDB83DRAFT_2321086 [Lactarius deliciosus]|nr:hypothetical protein EDB83DRAFT_2321086 [Lactarius deliciosus]